MFSFVTLEQRVPQGMGNVQATGGSRSDLVQRESHGADSTPVGQ